MSQPSLEPGARGRARASTPNRSTGKAGRVALAALLVAAVACGGQPEEPGPSSSTAVEVDLLELLPGDADLLGRVDLQALRRERVFEDVWGKRGEPDAADRGELEDLAEATGIDLRTDLQVAAIAGFVGGSDGEREMDAVAALAVPHDPDRLHEALSGRPATEHGAWTLYRLDDVAPGDGDEEDVDDSASSEGSAPGSDEEGARADVEGRDRDALHLAPIDERTLIVGTEAGVMRALDTVAGDAPSVRSDASLTELAELAPDGSQAWAVVTRRAFEAQLDDLPSEGPVPVPRKAIGALESLVAGVRVHDGVEAALLGTTGTPEDARLLAESLQGMLAIGKMMLQQRNQELFDIVDRSVDVSHEGSRVTVSTTMSRADFETLQGYARARMEPGGEAPTPKESEEGAEPEGTEG